MPAQARRAGRKKPAGPGLQVEVKGVKYAVHLSDMTPRLTLELRRETGFSFQEMIRAAQAGKVDVDIFVTLVWLSRRINGEVVSFDAVLDEHEDFVLDQVTETTLTDVGTPDEDAVPEA